MPLVVKDRVRETTTTLGTGTITLAGAVAGFQSFSAIGNANTTYYTINLPGANEWEVGIGTYTASGTTLSRDTILASSNGGSAVNFSAGTKDVFCTYPAGKSAYLDASNNLLIGTTTNTNTSNIVANGTISETVSGTQYLVASQFDVGTNPNQIPLNQYLGDMAFQSSAGVSIGILSVSGAASFTNTTDSSSTTTGAVTIAGGVGIAKKLYVGLDANVYGLTVGRGAGAVDTNTAVGASALAANTTGDQNVAIGYLSLLNNTTGLANIGLGINTLRVNTTGQQNTALGHQVLYDNTASYNTGAGSNTLRFNTTGANNTAFGFNALFSNTTANNNTAVGYQAAYSNISGSRITALGYQSFYSNTTSSDNTAIGYFTLYSNSAGTFNTAVGGGDGATGSTLSNNTTGSYNTGLGFQALRSNTTASYNTAVGYQAGYANITGPYNVLIGYRAGDAITTTGGNCIVGPLAGIGSTGQANTFVGALVPGVTNGCGTAMTTGSKNTILGGYSGNQDGLDIRTVNNYVVLSDGDGNRQLSMYEGGTVALDSALPVAGTGITFPATQSASSNANTLDDYEEGTWTPTATFATPGTVSTSLAVGLYTKVGNVVTAVGRIAITKGTASGNLVLGGLPFASNNTTSYQVAGTLSTDTFGVAGTLYQMLLASNSTVPEALAVTQSTGITNAVTASDFYATAGTLRFAFTYQI